MSYFLFSRKKYVIWPHLPPYIPHQPDRSGLLLGTAVTNNKTQKDCVPSSEGNSRAEAWLYLPWGWGQGSSGLWALACSKHLPTTLPCCLQTKFHSYSLVKFVWVPLHLWLSHRRQGRGRGYTTDPGHNVVV